MRQSSNAVLVVPPDDFASNPQTQSDNAFQSPAEGPVRSNAMKEFSALVQRLRAEGITVVIPEGRSKGSSGSEVKPPEKPDAVFPNNCISFHEDGKVVIYPMYAPNRRIEYHDGYLDAVSQKFEVKEVMDLRGKAKDNQFLEGTGSMIFDRSNKVIYACRSKRTDPDLLAEIASDLGYEHFVFDARGPGGKQVYHSNVMMTIGSGFAIVCLESIISKVQRDELEKKLLSGGIEVIPVTMDQMASFCCNALELDNHSRRLLVMSRRARAGFNKTQVDRIERYVEITDLPLETIEISGGSARCMLAEIFLPEKNQ